MQGEPFRFNVTNHGPSFISFSDPVNTWEVIAGSSNWTDARLCVRMTGNDGRVYSWAFDATTVTLGTQRITAPAPFSIYYSHADDRGTIQTAANNEISYMRGMVKLHAGEVSFSGLSETPVTRRESFLTVVNVVDGQGRAIPRARVSVNGSFIGLTDNKGQLPVPWSAMQPSVVVRSGEAQVTGVLIPGDMSFVLDTGQS
jgi:hypothetical protein